MEGLGPPIAVNQMRRHGTKSGGLKSTLQGLNYLCPLWSAAFCIGATKSCSVQWTFIPRRSSSVVGLNWMNSWNA